MGGEVEKLLSHNVFAYCLNNAVNMEDPSGYVAWWIFGAGIGAVAGAIAGAVYSYKTKGSVDWRYVARGAAVGACFFYIEVYKTRNEFIFIDIGPAPLLATESFCLLKFSLKYRKNRL